MNNSPIFTLPPHEYVRVITTLTQVQGWAINDSRVPNTWTFTEGEGETALVIDTGCPIHLDLANNLRKDLCRSFVPGSNIYDREGHSSHCCGIICAENNDTGMVGVAPKANVITAKALGDDGTGNFDWIVEALKYAKELKPTVVSMSLGAPEGSPALYKAIKELYDMDIPVVCAAGNDGAAGVNYPAKYEEVISVGAYDQFGNIANFSAIGDRIDWAAPGVCIYSTFLDNMYVSMNGTSMACPFMAGTILLLMAKHKKQEKETGMNDCKTIAQIRDHLLKYTVDKGIIGRDDRFGYGVIDIENMIKEGNVVVSIPVSVPSKKKTLWEKIKDLFKCIFK